MHNAHSGLGMLMDGGIFPLSTQYLPVESGQGPDGIPERIPDEILVAAREDDTVGSGIFDDYNNTNTRDGIFADRNSMPGYAARETGTGFSEVVDWQTGNRIVSLADGLRSGQIQGGNGYSSAPPYPAHAGASYPDVRTIASQVDFVGPAVPMSNDWAAQVATPNQPPFAPQLPYPLVDPSTWGIQGSQGMPRTGIVPNKWVDPNLPANAPQNHADVQPFGAPPAAMGRKAPWHGAMDMRAFGPPSGPRAGAGGVRLGPEGSRLPSPDGLAVAAMRGPAAQVMGSSMTYGGQRSAFAPMTSSSVQRNTPGYANAQMGTPRQATSTTGGGQRKPLSGLGGFGSLGELSLPGGDTARYFMWGVLGGVTLYMFASLVMGVDLVKEAKELVELGMSYITPNQEIRTDEKYGGLGAYTGQGGRAALSAQYGGLGASTALTAQYGGLGASTALTAQYGAFGGGVPMINTTGYKGVGALGMTYLQDAAAHAGKGTRYRDFAMPYGGFGADPVTASPSTSEMTVGAAAVGLGTMMALALVQAGLGYYVGQHLTKDPIDKTKYGIAGALIFGLTNPGIIPAGALAAMAHFGGALWVWLSSPQRLWRS